jgi:hypothetical protein
MRQKFKARSRSRGVIVFGVAAVLVVAVLGGVVWFFDPMTVSAPPTPLLLQARPGTGGDKANQEWFVQRLKERFPVASSEADLIRELWLEGFLPKTNLKAERRSADYDSLDKGGFRLCRLTANVSWTADEKGQVTDIDGGYGESCP